MRHHHERIDGAGYSDGLVGDEIPLLARIVSACAAYDAMVHTRQYREGMPLTKVKGILTEHARSRWDLHVVDELIAALNDGVIPEVPTVLADVGAQVGCSCTADLPVLEPAG